MRRKYKRFLKAAYINYDEDYCGCGSSTFIKPTITTPIIVITGNTAIIACAISGVTIYYTLDGFTPTSSSTEYTGAITLTHSCTIKAIAVKSGMTNSEVASESYVHYLTQWKMVGNSEVHTDPYLTQWKVSGNSQIQQYLTQWKVSGNSVVDNNTILSCGDLGQDGKYHVKISNGVNVFDIALDEPLRKVNDVADTIEFPSETEGKALVTRKLLSQNMGSLSWSASVTNGSGVYRMMTAANNLYKAAIDNNITANILCTDYNAESAGQTYGKVKGCAISTSQRIFVYDPDYNQLDSVAAFTSHVNGYDIILELAVPTIELVDAPQISVSPTNTYTSANETPYSAFTYANPLIYSCGDYSDVDGKYHVKISNGVDVYDIPLSEPLRKVGSVADKIEFANGTATVTRNIGLALFKNMTFVAGSGAGEKYRWQSYYIRSLAVLPKDNDTLGYLMCNLYSLGTGNDTYRGNNNCIALERSGVITIYDSNYDRSDGKDDLLEHIKDSGVLYAKITPTTETIQVPSIAVSPTDTYTSANETAYSAFEHTENKEIWSCGEYSAVDGKYHILVQPLGGSIADIALTEPLRMVDNVADTIEFPSNTEGKALVTRVLKENNITSYPSSMSKVANTDLYRITFYNITDKKLSLNILMAEYTRSKNPYSGQDKGLSCSLTAQNVSLYDERYNQSDSNAAFREYLQDAKLIYELDTPTTELIDAPQIEEAESYSMVISQGGKAVSWSDFETE